jgi:hypothetical protein
MALPGPQWHDDFAFSEPRTNQMKNFDWLMANGSYGSSVAYGYAVRVPELIQTNVLANALTEFYSYADSSHIINTYKEGVTAYCPAGTIILQRVSVVGLLMTSAPPNAVSITLPYGDNAFCT